MVALDVLWLVPLAYAAHIVEEAPRFVPWTKRYAWLFTSRFTPRLFVLGNAIWMVYVLISVILAQAYPSSWTIVLGLSTAAWIFSNFLLHAALTLTSGTYSPGVVTAGAVYVPVSLFVFSSVWSTGSLTVPELMASIGLGFAAMYIPLLNSFRVARKERAASPLLPQDPARGSPP